MHTRLKAEKSVKDVSFLSPQELSEYQEMKFKTSIDLAFKYHPYYRNLASELGFSAASLNFRNFDEFPPTTKNILAENYERFKLELPEEFLDPIWDIAYTSGSTSSPIPIYQTSRDFKAILLTQRRMAEIRGMFSSDVILNLFPLTQYPHGAWTRANHAAATLGALVACGMSGSADEEFGSTRNMSEVAQLAHAIQPTVFWGVPSYIKKVLDQIAHENLTIPSLRMIAVSGEACTNQMKQSLIDLAKAIGASVIVSNSLGASELQCGLVECKDGSGFHNPAPELFYFSVVDEKGKEVDEDTFGTLSVTHLDRRGTMLLKYLLGDQVRLTRSSCPECGRAGGRIIDHQGRAGSLIKIRGQLVDRTVLERTISEYPGVSDYMIMVRKADSSDGLSEDLLIVEIATVMPVDSDSFKSQISMHVKKQVNISPQIEIVMLKDLQVQNVSIKTSKFRDER